ncbi:hypothetical protein AB0E59_06235 [Lentzea sp. NPDC034063]
MSGTMAALVLSEKVTPDWWRAAQAWGGPGQRKRDHDQDQERFEGR